ncbi:hypothetical protein, partial [uncultured Phascolarctobacterium sp.]|uniref:hypothetical protein n=2 Tax=uncultured Phascolarctobacterium sp. TaxID=512296 RepID=UPI0026179269
AAASRRRVCLRRRQAMRSIALNSFPVMPSCPELGQRVKRNPNLNSAESSLRRLLSRKRHNKKEKPKFKSKSGNSRKKKI